MHHLRFLFSILIVAMSASAADTLVRNACICIGPNTVAYKYTIEYYNGRLKKSWKAETLCSGPPPHCSLDPTAIGLFCSDDKRFCYRFRNIHGDRYSLDGKDVRTPKHEEAVGVEGGCEDFCGGLGDEAEVHRSLAQGFYVRPSLL